MDKEKESYKIQYSSRVLTEMVFEVFISLYFIEISLSGVTAKEEAILRDQQIDLIYAQYGILYKIIHEALRSNI